MQKRQRQNKKLYWESQAKLRGFQCIAGVDEAGRGPLAGPVVAAACVLPDGLFIKGVDDSKKLLPSERFRIFEKVLSLPEIDYGVGVIDALIIDQVNILQATFQAMIAAISCLSKKPDYLLIDGDKMPKTDIPGQAIVQGDGLSHSIALASIIAKESRDRLMLGFHEKWPQYGFDTNKGYYTLEHCEAIEKYGPCPIHRRSFDPIKTQENFQYPSLLIDSVP